MPNVFELEGSLKLNTDDYKSKLNDAGKATQDTAQNLNARSVAIGNIISNLATKAGQYFVQAAKTGIEYNAQIETYTTSLTTALGNEADAAAAIEKIKQDAARTPYSVDGLVKANSYLIMAGESAGEARDTIMALGDAVSATGGGNAELQRMAQNLQQVKNVGKATSMDIRQFAMAGIDIYGILADYTGKTTAEVQELTITYDMLSGALQAAAQEGGKYYQAMTRQSQTLNGQISTLKDNVQQKLGEAFSGVAKTLSDKVLPKANEFVSSLDFEKVTKGAGIAATAVAALVLPFKAVTVATKAAATAQKLYNTALASAPLLAVAGMLAVAATAAVDYANTIDGIVDAEREYGETSDEVAARIEELKRQRQEFQDAADNGATEYSIYEQLNVLDQQIVAASEHYDELVEAEQKAAEESDEVIAAFDATADSAEVTTDALVEIITNYNALYESVSKKVESMFGIFDEATIKVDTSVKDMMNAMQSQINFNTQYSSNLRYLADNGLGELGDAFQSMGSEGAAYADALVQAIEEAGGATSEGGQQIINDFLDMYRGVNRSKDDLKHSLTDMTNSIDAAFTQMGVTAEQGAAALDVSSIAGTAGAASVNAYISAILNGQSRAYTAAEAVANSAAFGFGNTNIGFTPQRLAIGSDYIPYDDYPALLHKGEMVIPAKISDELRSFLGYGASNNSMPSRETIDERTYGGDNVTINVYGAQGQNPEELAEQIERIFINRSKRRALLNA